jgi:4-aminobutyrate--pyruvate transaminase
MAIAPGNSPEARDVASVLHPYTNLKKHEETGPLVIARGEGVWVYDNAGNGYIEGLAGLWSTSLGFGEERLIEAAARQMRELPYYHAFAHKSHLPMIDLAERLKDLAPVPMSHVFFANSGSEATDTVVKIVWYYNNAVGRPEKKKIISRMKAYHGVTVASASMTGLPANHADFDLPIKNIIHADCPHYYHHGEDGESEEDFATRMAANLEKLILDEGPDTIAAMIGEPIMGAGGVIVPPATYWEKVQEVLEKYDILLIADEVICGFHRTGNVFGSQTFNIKPNMMTVAKALSSSYLPISAVLMDEKVYSVIRDNSDRIGTFGHGYTYSGHPVSAAVALETLKIYEERNILEHVRAMAPRFQAGLQGFAEHPLVGEVRGVGLIGAIELVKNKDTRENFAASDGVGPYFMGRAQEHGLLCRAMMNDSVALCPPLVVKEDEIDEIMVRFGKALEDTAEMAAGL